MSIKRFMQVCTLNALFEDLIKQGHSDENLEEIFAMLYARLSKYFTEDNDPTKVDYFLKMAQRGMNRELEHSQVTLAYKLKGK